MQKTILTIVLATLCLNFSSKAQSKEPATIQPLKIGDSIPEAIWTMPLQVVNHPEGKKTILLNDYKNKLLILDFWATYCKPCIRSIQKLDSIKKDFKDEFIVIPVQVYDKEDQVMPFLKKKGLNWSSVVNDTLLNKVVLSRYLTGFGVSGLLSTY